MMLSLLTEYQTTFDGRKRSERLTSVYDLPSVLGLPLPPLVISGVSVFNGFQACEYRCALSRIFAMIAIVSSFSSSSPFVGVDPPPLLIDSYR